MGRGAISFYSTSFPPLFYIIMKKATLNSEQSTFLIKHIKESIEKYPIHTDEHKEFILLVQIYDILTGYSPKNNKPDESLRGSDSCKSGKCD